MGENVKSSAFVFWYEFKYIINSANPKTVSGEAGKREESEKEKP